MTKVEIVSSCLVGSISAPFMSKLDLTTWDLRLLQTNHIQKGLIYQNSKSHKNLIQHLKNSLSRALAFFPPLAGRLATTRYDDSTASFFVDCNNAGAEFTHAAAATVSVSDIIEPKYIPEIVHSLFRLNDTNNSEGISKPLLAVQATELADGLFIGCTANHAVVDGTSFWHFINSWSEISRGSDTISKVPVFERWYPSKSAEVNRRVHLPTLEKNLIPPSTLPQRVFRFTGENVAELKAKANSEAGTDHKISSLQAVLAHLWRSMTRCGHSSGGEARIMMAIGARGRVSLAEGYFGNAAYVAAAAISEADLLKTGLGAGAVKINEVVCEQRSEEIARYVEEKVEFVTLEEMEKSGPCVVVGGSQRDDVYGNDFGWGKPIAVRSGKAQKFDGLVVVLPAVEDGGIDVEVCLAQVKLQAMERDAAFMGIFL
ncbi:protein ENHANCED PSEUDOMONAS SUSCEPTIBILITY 1-like [Salvia hispanica]|uniref:protein ENHANCED PSEUDOMONAS SUSCEPTIBILITY 1-like n=1 Tax=Salvia hispanica TaxID=49212 RepID=UPI0020092D0F|nr:protein ENHANCED PSEUDOMONAS SUSCEPTIBILITY 1-like [Salvia hispanica]